MNERRWLVAVAPGVLVSILGLAAIVGGLALFGRGVLTPSSEFFANPQATMDKTGRDGFLGLLLFGGGSFALVASFGMVVFGLVLGLSRAPRSRQAVASMGFTESRCTFCQSPMHPRASFCRSCNAPQS